MRNDPRSHGLWERTAPAAPETTVLHGTQTVDVAIIGAGFTGLSAALHLAEAGTRVAVVEAEEIGFGGSGRNVGLVNAGMWIMPEDLPRILGAVHGERLLDALGEAPRVVFELIRRHGIDCEAETAGTLHCAADAAGARELAQRAQQWAARGADVVLLDAEETARRVGTPAYVASLLDRRAGTVQPLAYVRGLARAAIGAGATIFTGSPVHTAERDGSIWVLRTAEGEIRAPRVILATNAYTGALWPEIRTELTHLPYFNFATVPIPERVRETILPGREGAWDTRQVLSSFRFDRHGRLVFGSVGALRGTGTAIHRAWARRAMARLFPALAGIEFEAEWYGSIGMTADHLPRFHSPAPGVIGFSGYNGRGIAPGTVFGRLLAELLLDRVVEADLPLPRSEPRAAPLRHVMEAGYEVGAQAFHFVDARL